MSLTYKVSLGTEVSADEQKSLLVCDVKSLGFRGVWEMLATPVAVTPPVGAAEKVTLGGSVTGYSVTEPPSATFYL